MSKSKSACGAAFVGVMFHSAGFLSILPDTLKFTFEGHSITLGNALGCKISELALRFGITVVKPHA